MAAIRFGLAGDTMLGRGVAEVLATGRTDSLFSDEVVEAARAADVFVLNLECCVSERGEPWPDPRKPFFFRAPPVATEVLHALGVDCVTLANNHALDFGYDALEDTFAHLAAAGIAWVGAGDTVADARKPAVLKAGDVTVAVFGATDHPAEFAATESRAGVAFADFRRGVPEWLAEGVRASDADVVLVTPHWGPNMTAEPLPYVRAAARTLADSGATVVAGHSAHVFQGIDLPLLYDLGDFVDDYAVDPVLRNDLGLLFVLTLDETGPRRVDALPLELDYCHTRRARGDAEDWIKERLKSACHAFGTEVSEEDEWLVIAG